MKRDILKPIDDVATRGARLLRAARARKWPQNIKSLAIRLRESIRAAPQEFFVPPDQSTLIDDLERDLWPLTREDSGDGWEHDLYVVTRGIEIRFDELECSLTVLIRCAGEARKWWKPPQGPDQIIPRVPNQQARRHDVIGSAINGVWRAMTGRDASLRREPYGSESKGRFPAFTVWLAPMIGLSDKEASGIIEYRRDRYRSPYASVRAEVMGNRRPKALKKSC